MGNFNRGSRFGGRRDFGRRGFGGRGGRDREMHKTVCSECGKECQVPFKPTGSKPVFCSECFGKKGDRQPQNNAPFEAINTKLDKILAILETTSVKKAKASKKTAPIPEE